MFCLEKPTLSLLFVCCPLDIAFWYPSDIKPITIKGSEHSVITWDIVFLLSHIINSDANALGLLSEYEIAHVRFQRKYELGEVCAHKPK